MKDFKKYSDNELCEMLASRGSKRDRAFTELYHRYSQRILIFLRRLTGNERVAEDVFHDTFLSLLKQPERISKIANFSAYIHTIAKNNAMNEIKKRKNTFNIEDEERLPDSSTSDWHKCEVYSETAELIAGALDLLDDKQREIVCMQSYLGMSYNDIAESLSLPVSTIRNRIVRAKAKLREILNPYVGEFYNDKAEK